MVLCIAAKTSDIKIVGKLLIKDENFGTGVVSFVYHPGYSSGEVLPKKMGSGVRPASQNP